MNQDAYTATGLTVEVVPNTYPRKRGLEDFHPSILPHDADPQRSPPPSMFDRFFWWHERPNFGRSCHQKNQGFAIEERFSGRMNR